MQELIVNGLLAVVVVMAGVLLLMGRRKTNSMTKKQKVMLVRILAAAALLLGLQLVSEPLFGWLDTLWMGAGYWDCLVCYLADYLIIG